MSNNKQLIKAYRNYIELLEDEVIEIKHIAHEQGWKTTRFKTGKSLRREIKQLEQREKIKNDGRTI